MFSKHKKQISKDKKQGLGIYPGPVNYYKNEDQELLELFPLLRSRDPVFVKILRDSYFGIVLDVNVHAPLAGAKVSFPFSLKNSLSSYKFFYCRTTMEFLVILILYCLPCFRKSLRSMLCCIM